MSDNETIREDELEEIINEDVEETETDEVDEETTDNDEVENQVDWKAEALKYKAIALRKAKQAEKKVEPKKINSNLSIEETVLKAQGVSEDEIDMLKKVAKVQGVSLLDAQKDTIFTTWKTNFEAEKKQELAQLGASRRSGQKSMRKDFKTPGLSPEEHKAMWKEKMGIK
jgi:hypothetical protein